MKLVIAIIQAHKLDAVMKALDECVAAGQKELHILGWEWEMGLNDTVGQLAVETVREARGRQATGREG